MANAEKTKPGYKTSEFWFTVVASIVGLIFASGAVPETSVGYRILALFATIVGALGYTVSRSIVKSK